MIIMSSVPIMPLTPNISIMLSKTFFSAWYTKTKFTEN
jgi:hypothetical protein